MNGLQMQMQISVQEVQKCQMFLEQTKDTIETIKIYGECLKEYYEKEKDKNNYNGDNEEAKNNDIHTDLKLKKKLEFRNMAAAQNVDLYVITCQEVYKEKDYKSIKLGTIELKEYEKNLSKEPKLIRECLMPLINNMKLGLQNKAKEVKLTPAPKVKQFDQKAVNKAMGNYFTGQHEFKDQQNQVKQNVGKFGNMQDNMIRATNKRIDIQQFQQEKVEPSKLKDVLSHYDMANLEDESAQYQKTKNNTHNQHCHTNCNNRNLNGYTFDSNNIKSNEFQDSFVKKDQEHKNRPTNEDMNNPGDVIMSDINNYEQYY